jgi:regulator of sigma D
MMYIKLVDIVGSFAENKDIAKSMRIEQIHPALEKGEQVILDFEGVSSATQSFIHALISELMREYGGEVLERVSFKNCSETVQKIIEIVADYMQQSD